jgi:photosynthetic reaction center cytochrome c subunit
MNPFKVFVTLACAGLVVIVGLLAGYHRTEVVQRGYRGTAMSQLYRESYFEKEDVINKFPKPLGPAKTDGPTAAETYENVHVLGDLSKSQFARTMLSIKSWVAPEVGCNFCHAAPIYNSDEKYQKRVARKMIAMTRHINTDWTAHVGKTGVTCYTCHRGQAVPAKIWFQATENDDGLMQKRPLQRPPTPAAADSSLPADSLTEYLLHDDNIRVNGVTPLQTGNRNSVQHARQTYTLMMVMSESLGVNCDFCHNTRALASWELSTPQRVTAWYGIRMVRDLNNNVMLPLKTELPAERLGPGGDVPKIYCATCHNGSNKPLYGAPMLQYYPELVRPGGPRPLPGQEGYTATPDAPAPDDAAPATQKTAKDAAPAPLPNAAPAALPNTASLQHVSAAAAVAPTVGGGR